MTEIADSNLPARDVIRHLTHELRQPLSALDSIAFYLQMTVGGESSDVSAQVNRLQQMVDNANWVLSDVVYLMQMAPPQLEVVNCQELMEEMLTESWACEGLSITVDTAGDIPGAWVDPAQIRHMLRSVLQFLRRSVEEPRAVGISVSAMSGTVQVHFVANAPQVVPAALFHPLEGNQLYTSRRIAANNGGEFDAVQDEQGRLSLRLAIPAAATS